MTDEIDILQLNPVPSAKWNERYRQLMSNPWLARKLNRQVRLNENYKYILDYCPEIQNAAKGLVVDVGPGPGEFLELCREIGHTILGVDASQGAGGMGDEYLAISKLMTARQKVPVEYIGFENWINQHHPNLNNSVVLINFRGSIEQALARHMMGPPHDLHHDCKQLEWSMTAELREVLEVAFMQMAKLVRTGGHILIHANGARNTEAYDRLVKECAEKTSLLYLVKYVPPRLHKWVRL